MIWAKLNNIYLSIYLHVFIQAGLGNNKLYFLIFKGPWFTSLSYSASLQPTSAVEMSAVFGAPIFSGLGWCAYTTGEEEESQIQSQVLAWAAPLSTLASLTCRKETMIV